MAKRIGGSKRKAKFKLLKKVEIEEQKIEHEEKKVEAEERRIEQKEKEIETIEKRLEKEVEEKPLKYYHWKDFAKSIVGAFAGMVGHFAFLKGADVAAKLDFWRAAAVLAVSYLLGYILMYRAGFRKVREIKLFKVFPLRLTITFFIAIATIVLVLFLFGELESNLMGIYKQVAAISIVAMLGAGIADLAGKD